MEVQLYEIDNKNGTHICKVLSKDVYHMLGKITANLQQIRFKNFNLIAQNTLNLPVV